MKRTDIHRTGSIVPANYDFVMFYSLPTSQDGHRVPSCGLDCVHENSYWKTDENGKQTEFVSGKHLAADGTCCVVAFRQTGARFAEHGGTGQCTVCGARFAHGAIWQHVETGECINIGHDCADKYEMLKDRSEHELRLNRVRQAAAVEIIKVVNREKREKTLADNPGLAAALETDHHIVRDIKDRFTSTAWMSEKQIALVLKLAREAFEPKQEEVHVPAPEGRVRFIGEVVATKVQDGYYGPTVKMTVKVRTDAGVWLAWMTVPSSVGFDERQRGSLLDITATLKQGREPHFAFGSRPNAVPVFEGPADVLAAAVKKPRKPRRAKVEVPVLPLETSAEDAEKDVF